MVAIDEKMAACKFSACSVNPLLYLHGNPRTASPHGYSLPPQDGLQLDSLGSREDGNRLEALTGDRKGQYSIRINDQWRS